MTVVCFLQQKINKSNYLIKFFFRGISMSSKEILTGSIINKQLSKVQKIWTQTAYFLPNGKKKLNSGITEYGKITNAQ